MKMNVIYWSASGNTQAMAEELARAARDAGADVQISNVRDASVQDALHADVLALGCPAMDAEVIEIEEMDPFVTDLERAGLSGKKLILFGSYDWGDGEWMRNWQSRMTSAGAVLVTTDLIAHNAPDEDVFAMLNSVAKKAVLSCS